MPISDSLTESGVPNEMPGTIARKWLSWICALILLAAGAGCATQYEKPPKGTPWPGTSKLVSGDVIRISFPGAVEMDQVQRIPPDGKLALPMIGEVKAGGRSLTSLQGELQGRYKAHLQNPAVIVAVQSAANSVFVMGAVNKPGKVQLDRAMTLYEALMEAGGISRPYGDPKKVFLQRIENGQHRSYRVDVSPAKDGLPIDVVYLKPSDIVLVSGAASSMGTLSGSYQMQ